jgi:hypothetical protein
MRALSNAAFCATTVQIAVSVMDGGDTTIAATT